MCDVHHHYSPLQSDKGNTGKKAPGKGLPGGPDIRRSLDMMARCNVRRSILSYPVWFPGGTGAYERDMCRRVNEAYVGLSAGYPSLGAFALLPFSNGRYHLLGEMEHALDILRLEGVLLPSNLQEICPDRNVLPELYRELDRRRACVFIHPVFPFGKEDTGQNVHVTMKEVTRAACELVFGRMAELYPGIRFILSYGGGNISFFFHRIKSGALYPDLTGGFGERDLSGVGELFRRFYYDTAFTIGADMLNCLKSFVPKTHMLYGSDFPSLAVEQIGQNLEYSRYVRCGNGQSLLECLQGNSSIFGNGTEERRGTKRKDKDIE